MSILRKSIRSLSVLVGMAIGLSLVLATCESFAKNPRKSTTTPQTKVMTTVKNEDFYRDGKFQADKAKEAYFDMMKRFNYPIPESLKNGMWATDFSLGDFAQVGMAGIFWYNDKETNVFGHEIYLLPGQMIVEHGHETAGDVQAKREAWHVRHGSIYTFGEGDVKEPAPIQLPESQKEFITVKGWKEVKAGEVDSLKRATAKHFMIAGPEGAIVTEYGTFHDNAGLRFTNPKVKF